MVTSVSCPESRMRRITLRPNRSLSWRQSMVFLGAIALPLLLVSVVLAAKGYWMIVPFAGLEIAVLYACLYVVAHATCRCEVISVGESLVTVEKGRDRGLGPETLGPEQRTEFARGWVKVELSASTGRWYPKKLWIGASGRRVEIAEFLVEEEKTELAAELHRLLTA